MSDFSSLSLHESLLEAIRRLGWDDPTPLQAAAYPVLRRGGNALLRGSPGAGLVGAYGLPLIDALLDGDTGGPPEGEDGAGENDQHPAGPRILVLTPTPDRAEHVARELAALCGDAPVAVSALAPGWPRAGRATLVAADVREAARRISRSALKLGNATALVVDGVNGLGEAAAADLESILAALPAGAQRVVSMGREDPASTALAERIAPKAIGIPARGEGAAADEVVGEARYRIAEEAGRVAALSEVLAASVPARVFARSAARAAAVAADLAERGFEAGAEGSTVVVGDPMEGDASGVDATEGDGPVAVSYDVPTSAEGFAERHAEGGVVFLAARELPHALRAAAAAGVRLTPAAEAATEAADGELASFRGRIARALRDADLAAQTLVLAPLVEEHGALRVAAAVSALLRAAPAAPSSPGGGTDPGAASGVAAGEARGARASRPGAAPAPEGPPAYTRLFLSVGRKDGAGPGDIVGAIAGETGVSGERIGRIELAETHAIAEVATSDARRVIDALNGTTIRGRSVRVDFDRPRRTRTERSPRRPGPR